MKAVHFLWIWLMTSLSLSLSPSPPHHLHAEVDDSLTVTLATENALTPLYLLPFQHEQANWQEAYIQQLEKILTFDLHHNGSIFLIKHLSDNDQLGLSGAFNQLGAIDRWKEKHVDAVIKVQIQQNSLITIILDVRKQFLKATEPFILTGDLAQDRRQMHRLADTIHKALFGVEGIASTKILYTIKNQSSADSRQWYSEVWEVDYDGANPHQLTQDHSSCVTPIYLPPKLGYLSGGFLYVSYKLGQPKIYIASLKDGIGRRLTYLKGNQLMPAISQQRDKIAFICDITGNPDLFLQTVNLETGALGKPQQIFSAQQATQGSPTFSPDGNRIAFVSNKDGSPKIYVINIPTPGASLKDIKAILISKANRENSAPAWSPDGQKIAYCARGKGDRQIWVYDFNTNQEKQITQGGGHKENPSWASDSLHLVFNSSDRNNNDLFIINLNQNEAVKITSGPGEKRFPSWEPRLN